MWNKIKEYLTSNTIIALPTDKGNCVIPMTLEDRVTKEVTQQFEDISVVCAELQPLLPEVYKCEVSEPSRRYPEPSLFIGRSTAVTDYTFDYMK